MDKSTAKVTNFNQVRNLDILTPLLAFVLLFVLLSILSPSFLTVSNLLNVLRQVSVIAIVAIGMSYAILVGGIDLSVGAVVALSGVVTAILMRQYDLNMYLAILCGLSTGLASGAIIGSLVSSRIKMPPFIAGLAMMSVVRGISLIISDGRPIYNLPDSFRVFGTGFFYGIPVPVIIMIIVYIIAYVNLKYTKLGTSFYAIGGNEEAARVSGINVKRSKLFAFMISGVAAAGAGVVLASRVMVGEPIAGLYYELDAVAASVIGGARIGGGVLNIWGTFLGALIIGFLRNGLNLLNVSTYYQMVAIGLVIICMISFNLLRKS